MESSETMMREFQGEAKTTTSLDSKTLEELGLHFHLFPTSPISMILPLNTNLLDVEHLD